MKNESFRVTNFYIGKIHPFQRIKECSAYRMRLQEIRYVGYNEDNNTFQVVPSRFRADTVLFCKIYYTFLMSNKLLNTCALTKKNPVELISILFERKITLRSYLACKQHANAGCKIYYCKLENEWQFALDSLMSDGVFVSKIERICTRKLFRLTCGLKSRKRFY